MADLIPTEAGSLPDQELTVTATPDLTSLHESQGAGSDYTAEPGKKWYILRVSYNRYKKAKELIDQHQLLFFHPMHNVEKRTKGNVTKLKLPLLWNLIFVYATEKAIIEMMKDPKNVVLSFYYNHFVLNRFGKNEPLTVSEYEMRNFILMVSLHKTSIALVDARQCRFKSGERVRIKVGELAGVEGRVARALGKQRVIVEITHLCMVATAYIPTACLERCEPPSETTES